MDERLANYLRTHRKKAGLSQRELGRLLGYEDEVAVSRHEQSRTLPPLLIAISYEVIFKTPIAELFPGIRVTAERIIERRILEFESELQERSGKGARASLIAQKLVWFSERRALSEK